MFAVPGSHAPLTVPRQDRPTFCRAVSNASGSGPGGPDEVVEVDGGAGPHSAATRVVAGGRVAQLAVSSTQTGQAVLAILLESGLIELWDLGDGGGSGAVLLDTVHVANREKLLKIVKSAAGSGGGSGIDTSNGGGDGDGGQEARLGCLLAGAVGLDRSVFFLAILPPGSGGSGGGAASSSSSSSSSSTSSSTHLTLHVLGVQPSPSLGAQRLDAIDSSRRKAPVVALACHESRPLLCVGFADGVLHLYDTSRTQQDTPQQQQQQQQQQEEEEGERQRGAGGASGQDVDGEDDGGGSSSSGDEAGEPAVVLTKAQQQLLLVPVAALKFAQPLAGPLSCVAFGPESGLVAAGTAGGEMAVWSTVKAGREPHAGGGRGSTTLASMMSVENAGVPLLRYAGAPSPTRQIVTQVEFVLGGSPFLVATVCEAAATAATTAADGPAPVDHPSRKGKTTRLLLLAMLPGSIALVQTSQPLLDPARLLFHARGGFVLIEGEGAAAGGPRAPGSLRQLAIQDALRHPAPAPVLAAVAAAPPTAVGAWPAAWGIGGGGQSMGWPQKVVSLQTRLHLSPSAPGQGPLLFLPRFKSMLVVQPLEGLQKPAGDESSGATEGGRPAGFLIPANVSELRVALRQTALGAAIVPALAKQLRLASEEQEAEALLVPRRLVVGGESGDAVLALVLCQPLLSAAALSASTGPRDRAFDLSPSSPGGSQPAPALVYMLVRCHAPASDAGEPRHLAVVQAGLARDAVFLSPAEIAVLHEDGHQVSILRPEGNAGPFSPTASWRIATTTTLQRQLAEPHAAGLRLFPLPGSRAAALLCVVGGAGQPSSSWRLLLLESVGEAQPPQQPSSASGATSAAALELGEDERVLDAAWQTGLDQVVGLTRQVDGAVLGVLTSRRVLLLSSKGLAVLVAVAVPAATTPTHGGHLLWLGPALAVALADGRVLYVGVDVRTGEASLRPLCTLDQRRQGLRLVAALPDRLLYGARAGGAGGVRVLTRPLLPLEPLVAGFLLLLLPRLMSTDDMTTGHAAAAVLQAVADRYGPAWLEGRQPAGVNAATAAAAAAAAAADFQYGAGEGPGGDAGATCAVCAALCRAGFLRLAAAVSGGDGSAAAVGPSAEGQATFRRRPWLPTAVKAGIAAGQDEWRAALLGAMADDPVAQEYAAHPGPTQSAALPGRLRGLAHRLAALGESARAVGHPEAALRLLDAAGADDAVVELLVLHSLATGAQASAGPSNDGLKEGCAALLRELFGARTEPHLLAVVQALLPAWKGSTGVDEVDQVAAVTPALAGKMANRTIPFAQQRRQALLPALPGGQELPLWRRGAKEAQQAAAAAPAAAGPPRPPRVHRLVLDRVDEWLGRSVPEAIFLQEDEDAEEMAVAAAAREASAVGQSGAGAAGAGPAAGAGAAAPAGASGVGGLEWVKGVGQGREDEDNVVLYYRFSELAPVPCTDGDQQRRERRRYQGDLSPHAIPVDVVCDRPGAVAFEESTCPMDQGDDGKVRPALDVVWGGSECEGTNDDGGGGTTRMLRGLAFPAPRGSALDVGPYHQGARSKLTAELWVQRPEAGTAATTGAHEVLLARRTQAPSEGGQAEAIWTLGVLADGALAFWTGDDAATTGDGRMLQSTAPGTVPAGRWTHVAFTLEGQGKAATVTLFVGGRPAAAAVGAAQLRMPAVPEARLRSTVLELGPNLRGHRVTELRLWAIARHADDVYDNRESYLKLAEKRKRLAFKIKAGPDAAPSTAAGGAGGGLPPQAAIGSGAAAAGEVGGGTSALALGIAAVPAAPGAAARRRTLGTPSPSPTPDSGLSSGAPGGGGLALPALQQPPGPRSRRPLSRRGSPSMDRQQAEVAAAAGVPEAAPSPVLSSSAAAPAVATGWAADFDSWSGAAASADPAGAGAGEGAGGAADDQQAPSAPEPPPAPAPSQVAGPAVLARELVLMPADLELDAGNILPDPTAPCFSPGGRYICFRELSAGAAAPGDKPRCCIVVLTLEGEAPRRTRYPFQTDSAILVEAPPPSTASFIACATSGESGSGGSGGALQVYDLEQRKGVARQPAQTQILHWRWIASNQLALVTHRAVFRWTIGAGAPPVKLFERRDLAGIGLGGHRRVRAYHQEAGGWGVLTTEGEQQEGVLCVHLYEPGRGALYLESGPDLVAASVGRCAAAHGAAGEGEEEEEQQLVLVVVRRPAAGEGPSPQLEVYAGTPSAPADAAGPTPPSLAESMRKLARLPVEGVDATSCCAPGAPVWILFPRPGTGKGAISVLFGGPGGILASVHVRDGGEAPTVQLRGTVLADPTASATVRDACLDRQGDLLVLQEGALAVWRVETD